jgi:phosphate transport system substrate-binding protein
MPKRISGEIQMYATKNNDMAVSPIVATLVLIVVAVIGAVAVGTIMGSFSSDVSKKASAGQAGDASSTDVLIAGSTTIQPAMNTVAADFMAANPGVKLNVQPGGSGAGLASVAAGVANIGMFSQAMDANQIKAYPTVKQYIIGYGGVVAIVNSANAFTATGNVTPAQLGAVYNSGDFTGVNGAVTTPITKAITRSDVSGTADSFATLCGITNIYSTSNSAITAANGNGAMVTAVKADTVGTTIGFTDLDYALTTSGISYFRFVGTPVTTAYDYKGVADAKNGVTDAEHFPAAAVRPLELLTLGNPDAISSAIIQFTQSPNEAAAFHSINLVHVSDIVTL